MSLIAVHEGLVEVHDGERIDVCVDMVHLYTGTYTGSDRKAIYLSHATAKHAFNQPQDVPRWKEQVVRIPIDEIQYINLRN